MPNAAIPIAGCGVSVVKLTTKGFVLDEQALEELLLRDDIKDLGVVVLSVAGKYREGKSFLMSFLVRYMYAIYNQANGGNWLVSHDEPLKGFSWRGGTERDTTGILLWSEPIVATLPDGQKVAILLMDTQGTFDDTSTVNDCAKIFALSSLLSSVQMFNIYRDIGEDNLQHLQLFTEYGRMVQEKNGVKPFQNLHFLIRDWYAPYKYDYGSAGGAKMLEEKLKIKDEQHEELKEIREHIRSCFEKVECFLLPYPGTKVASDINFNGCLSDIDSQFVTQLGNLLPHLLSPQKLVVKQMCGRMVTVKDFVLYFKMYMKLFNSGELPKPLTIMNATAEINNLSAVAEANTVYTDIMQKLLGDDNDNISIEECLLKEEHKKAKLKALQSFQTKKKMGGDRLIEDYRLKLIKELDEIYNNYIKINEANVINVILEVKQCYDRLISEIQGIDNNLCIHPKQLEEEHGDAVQKALNVFNEKHKTTNANENSNKTKLKLEFNENYNKLCSLNGANNMNAVAELLKTFKKHMGDAFDRKKNCMHPDQLEDVVQKAKRDVMKAFQTKRNNKKNYPIDKYEKKLQSELEELSKQLFELNEEKHNAAIREALDKYNSYMSDFCAPDHHCYHPIAFDAAHKATKETAIDYFHSKRGPNSIRSDNDSYITNLDSILDERYKHYQSLNNARLTSLFNEAHTLYVSHMESVHGGGHICLHTSELEYEHERIKEMALEYFDSRRVSVENDEYRMKLEKEISEKYDQIFLQNVSRNDSAVRKAFEIYRNRIDRVCGEDTKCLHPNALDEEHEDAKSLAENEFYACRRQGGEVGEQDYHINRLIQDINVRYNEVHHLNKVKNDSAIAKAREEYEHKMESIYDNTYYMSNDLFSRQHNDSKSAALDKFYSYRNTRDDTDDDTYKDILMKELDEREDHYIRVNNRKPVYEEDETASNVIAAAAALGAAALGGAAVIATGGAVVPALAAGAATAEAVAVGVTLASAGAAASAAAVNVWRWTKSLFKQN